EVRHPGGLGDDAERAVPDELQPRRQAQQPEQEKGIVRCRRHTRTPVCCPGVSPRAVHLSVLDGHHGPFRAARQIRSPDVQGRLSASPCIRSMIMPAMVLPICLPASMSLRKWMPAHRRVSAVWSASRMKSAASRGKKCANSTRVTPERTAPLEMYDGKLG